MPCAADCPRRFKRYAVDRITQVLGRSAGRSAKWPLHCLSPDLLPLLLHKRTSACRGKHISASTGSACVSPCCFSVQDRLSQLPAKSTRFASCIDVQSFGILQSVYQKRDLQLYWRLAALIWRPNQHSFLVYVVHQRMRSYKPALNMQYYCTYLQTTTEAYHSASHISLSGPGWKATLTILFLPVLCCLEERLSMPSRRWAVKEELL